MSITLCTAQIPELVVVDLQEGVDTVFYDSTLQVVDRQKAHFFMMSYFHLGKDVWNENQNWRKKQYSMVWSGVNPGKEGNPVPLNGVVKWFTGDYARLVAQEQFENGRYKGQTILYDKKGRYLQIVDYNKKWNSEDWSFYIEKFRKGKIVKASYEILDPTTAVWKSVCTEGCYVSKDLRP